MTHTYNANAVGEVSTSPTFATYDEAREWVEKEAPKGITYEIRENLHNMGVVYNLVYTLTP